MLSYGVLLVLVCSILVAGKESDDFLYGTFPSDFLWSSATSSYQIEGAWDADEKGENIWDYMTHNSPGKIEDQSNGDVACDSYNKIEEDVRIMKDMGVQSYRFSLSWARILPDGTKASISQKGVNYYKALIAALKKENIIPFVTLYHWDLPQQLENKGGWLNETIIDYYKDYARICFQQFGNDVKWWLTFNEPFVFTWLGYGLGIHAPGIKEPKANAYTASHNMIKAHAEAWHMYDKEFRPTQKGQISITLNSDWNEPRTQKSEDILAAVRQMQFFLGWYAHPIFVNGDYPEVMKEKVKEKSKKQGYSKSRLPEFTQQEKQRINGTHDFFGLNHYTSAYISHKDLGHTDISYDNDKDTEVYSDPSWPTSGSAWLKVVPWGLRKLLVWIKDNYGNPPIYITENGISDRNATLQDTHRVNYYRDYINQAFKAYKLDGVNLKGYTAWSLMDNFEWAQGYTEKFGMHHVDFNDPKRPRTPKDSARYFAKLIKDNGFIKENSAISAKASIVIVLVSTLVGRLTTIF